MVKQILLEGNCMLKSQSATKKILRTLELDYDSIHACPNDHVLFKKELANEIECP